MLRLGIAIVLSLVFAPVWAGAHADGVAAANRLAVPAARASANEAAVPAAAVRHWPAAGLISYEVLRGEGGMKLGEARHRWQHDGKRYSMATEVETTGLAGLLYSFRYVQHSEGQVLDGGLRPERFRVEQDGKSPESARFDWAAGKVVIERRGKATEYPIHTSDQDVLSVWHLVGLLNGRAPPSELTVVTSRVAAPAALEVLGREAIRLPIGELEALRVRVSARSGRLTIDLWLSEDHRRLPVRIRITDDKGEVLDQRALAVEFKGE